MYLHILQVNTLSRYIKCSFHVLVHVQLRTSANKNQSQPSHCFCSRQSDIFHGGSDGTTIRVAEPKSLFTWVS